MAHSHTWTSSGLVNERIWYHSVVTTTLVDFMTHTLHCSEQLPRQKKHCYCSSEGLRQTTWSCLNWLTCTFMTTWAVSRHSDMIHIRGAAESQAEYLMIHHTLLYLFHFTQHLHILFAPVYTWTVRSGVLGYGLIAHDPCAHAHHAINTDTYTKIYGSECKGLHLRAVQYCLLQMECLPSR